MSQHVRLWFLSHSVNYEIFAKFQFLRNFIGVKFHESKTLMKWRNHSVVYICKKIMAESQIVNMANMSLNNICENQILTKISEFKVHVCTQREGSDKPAHMSLHCLYTQRMEDDEGLDEILDI